MVDIARDPAKFTFLSDCAGNTPIVIGDARLQIAKQPAGRFDIIVIDALFIRRHPAAPADQGSHRHLRAR